METFSFNLPINLVQEGKWMIAVISFEATNSVFNITDEYNGFSNTTTVHWNSKDVEELSNKLRKIKRASI